MGEERKKTGWTFWACIALLALVAYPVSFGPACWIVSHANLNGRFVTVLYRPMIWVWCNGPASASNVVGWYSMVGAAEGWGWVLPFDQNYSSVEDLSGRWLWTK